MSARLDGKVCLATGASRGVGNSGSVLVAGQLARDYGFTDVDGRCPRPLTLDTV